MFLNRLFDCCPFWPNPTFLCPICPCQRQASPSPSAPMASLQVWTPDHARVVSAWAWCWTWWQFRCVSRKKIQQPKEMASGAHLLTSTVALLTIPPGRWAVTWLAQPGQMLSGMQRFRWITTCLPTCQGPDRKKRWTKRQRKNSERSTPSGSAKIERSFFSTNDSSNKLIFVILGSGGS